MSIHPFKGRPFGGRSFIIKKRIKVIKYEFINRYLATLSCNDNSNIISLISCYFPYDNGTHLNFSEFQSCLQVAYELLHFYENLNHSVFIIGDINADLLRSKRFDVIFGNFIKNNNMLLVSMSLDPLLFSYKNGDYKAKLDHCLISSSFQTFNIINSNYIDDVINLSDHKPLLVSIEWNLSYIDNSNTNVIATCDKIIIIPPNFDNLEIKEKFNVILKDEFNNCIDTQNIINLNNQMKIDKLYCCLKSSIKSAYDKCSRVISSNKDKQSKIWWTNDLKKLKSSMLVIKYKIFQTEEDKIKYKRLRKDFKNLMKKNIFLYEKNEYYKIGNLIKAKNGDKFFKSVNSFLNKNKNCELDVDTVLSHYDSIFNEPLNIDNDTMNEVMDGIDDLKHVNFEAINVNVTELKYAFKKTNISRVVGDDGLSSYMLLNINKEFFESVVLSFFQFIFTYSVIPANLNNTHIIPIIKDKTKSQNVITNLRPISISNTLSQIFERIVKIKVPQLSVTHMNQFGYKFKTSCSHALFAFKELAIKCIEDKKLLFAAKLDAVKAFDRLWRDALFLKVKKKVNYLSIVILIKIYYDTLQAKVKINNTFSKSIKLQRCVKQGGVLSGDLFNCFIDDLIIECCNSGFGASYFDIILSILGFCDDLCLFSCNDVELRKLLLICERFAKKWGIEFNASKCQFIVFGTRKYDNSIFLLNNSKINYTDKFKYLGLTFSPDLNMSEFFIEKFQIVKKSFFSLNSFGFKCNGVNPFLQSFIYKSFCISRILYGFEIMTINKKTLKKLNIAQNDLVRYMTGLSRKSHISETVFFLLSIAVL